MSHSNRFVVAAISVSPAPERRFTLYFASFFAILSIAAITMGGQIAMAQARETALSCSLGEKDLRARRSEVLTKLWEAAREIEHLEKGFALQYEDKDLDDLVEFIAFERKCCPFFSFTLDFQADSGPIWLAITGPDGAKELLEAELQPVLKRLQSEAASNEKQEKPGLVERLIKEVVACCATEKK